jgi:hypothetical protein
MGERPLHCAPGDVWLPFYTALGEFVLCQVDSDYTSNTCCSLLLLPSQLDHAFDWQCGPLDYAHAMSARLRHRNSLVIPHARQNKAVQTPISLRAVR